jgi:hypothetical protein
MTPAAGSPPHRLVLSVALVTAAMLFLELVTTRLFSVLFFYHYSFFAVSLVMSGLSLGGLLASRWDLRAATDREFRDRLGRLAILFSGATLGAVLFVASRPVVSYPAGPPSTSTVALFAVAFVPGLVAAGAFLAAIFSRDPNWIARLYAADLGAAAVACAAAILLLRVVQTRPPPCRCADRPGGRRDNRLRRRRDGARAPTISPTASAGPFAAPP